MYIYDTYIDFDVASVSEGGSRTSLTEPQSQGRSDKTALLSLVAAYALSSLCVSVVCVSVVSVFQKTSNTCVCIAQRQCWCLSIHVCANKCAPTPQLLVGMDLSSCTCMCR